MKTFCPGSSSGKSFLTSLRSFLSLKSAGLILLLVACGFALVAWQSNLSAQAQSASLNITTIAGGQTGAPPVASFLSASGIAVTTNGAGYFIYVADTGNHVVRRIDTVAATVTTVTGIVGDAGSTGGRLSSPSDVALDSQGNLYILDTGNNRLLKVATPSTTPTVTTVSLGIETLNAPLGLGIDSSNPPIIYIADTGNHRILRINNNVITSVAGTGEAGDTGDTGPATQAQLRSPADVAAGNGNTFFIADTGNNLVRYVDGTTLNIDKLPGTSNADFNTPRSLAFDTGNLYISDTGGQRIRKVLNAGNIGNTLSTIVGDGNQGYNGEGDALTRNLNVPWGIAVLGSGAQVFFMDSGNRRVRLVSFPPVNGTVSTLVSDGSGGFSGDNGAPLSAQLNVPRGVAVDKNGNYYIADTAHHVIRKVTKSGNTSTITTIAGTANSPGNSGDGLPATQGQLNSPVAVAVDDSLNVYISDNGNNVIRMIDLNGNLNTLSGFSGLSNPQGLAVDSAGALYVANTGGHRILKRVPAGTVSAIAGTGSAGNGGDNGSATLATLRNPMGVAVAANGVVYIADTGNHRIRRIDLDNIIRVASGPSAVRADFEGDGIANGARGARFNTPTDVAVDSNGDVFIVDRGNNRIRRITTNGTINGDTAPNDDTINTVIGSGVIGFSGDNPPAVTPATQAALNLPYDIAAGTDGIYVADTGNNRIRLATAPPNSTPTLAVKCNNVTCNPTLTIAEGQTLTIVLEGTDVDFGQTLTYTMRDTATNQPVVGATLTPTTGASSTFTYTPAFTVAPNQVGGSTNIVVEFKVADSASPSLSATETRTITVTNVNQVPTASITNVTPGTTDQQGKVTVEATGTTGAQVQLTGTATDGDNDTLTFQWSDNNVLINGATTLTPNVTLGLGLHSLTLTVNDGKGGVVTTAAKLVEVKDTQAPQFANVPGNISRLVAQNATGDIVTYQLPTATDTVDGNRTVNVSPADKTPGAFFPLGTTTVTFTATDVSGNTATASFQVSISNGSQGGTTAVYKINAFAGNGSSANTGNGGPAATASFRLPHGVAIDASGNVFIADPFARVVRRVAAQDGLISIYAGNGEKGFSGDNGPATSARLNNPRGLTVDAQGNLYIADTDNQRIRRVTPGGTISTIAGNGLAGFSGDNGQGTQARLNFPMAVSIDAQNNLYIADTNNHRIRKLDALGSITTVAGSVIPGSGGDGGPAAAATLNTPTGVAVTPDGSTLYIADRGNHRVRRVANVNNADQLQHVISTYAGNGEAGFSGDNALATAASLNQPTDVAVDAEANVLVTDLGNDRIRRISFTSQQILTIAGTGAAGNSGDGGPALSATLDLPTMLAIDQRNGQTKGEVYFSDQANSRVRKLTINNDPPVPTTVANQRVRVDRTLDIPLAAADSDNDPVSFTIESNTPLPFLSIINPNQAARTATLRVNPANNNALIGVYNLRIRATDSKQASTLTPEFSITIAQNAAPTAVISGGSQVSVNTNGGSVTLVIDGSGSNDPDGDPLTYSWKINGVGFGGNTTSITPTLAANQTHTIMLTVSDGTPQTGTVTQTVIVTGPTDLPAAVITGPDTLNSSNGAAVSQTYSGATSSGTNLTYQWKVNNQAFGGNTSSITPSLSVGTHTIMLTVSNNSGTSSAMKTVVVSQGGPQACIDGAASETVNTTNNTPVTVNLTSACTTGQGTLTFEWRANNVVTGGNTASLSTQLAVGTHSIELRVTDSQNRSSTATKSITVQNQTTTPAICGNGVGLYICSISPLSGRQGQTVEVTIEGSGFQPGATVVFSPGQGGTDITTTVLSVTNTQIRVSAAIRLTATTSGNQVTKRSITIINSPGVTVTTSKLFSVLSR